MRYREIELWGDSILKGVVFDEARGRYVILKENAVRLLADKTRVPLSNHSLMGRTAPQGLKAIEESDEPMDDKLVLIEYGGNDCDYDWAQVAEDPDAPHACNTPDARFVEALERITEVVRRKGGTPMLCSMPPLDAHRYFDWITRGGLSRENILKFIGVPERIYRWQEYYSSLVLRTAGRLGVRCLPVREAFLQTVRGEDVLCVDGIHPNRAGHAIMADVAEKALSGLITG